MVKEKPDQVRVYAADGYRLRAAGVCVRDKAETEVLLVSGSRHPDRWVVPGGGIEPSEDAGVAALREVQEEAGVKGELGRCLGIFENLERKTRTSVYILVVAEQLEEWEDEQKIGRKRKWFSLEEALAQLGLHKPVQQDYLKNLNSHKPVS